MRGCTVNTSHRGERENFHSPLSLSLSPRSRNAPTKSTGGGDDNDDDDDDSTRRERHLSRPIMRDSLISRSAAIHGLFFVPVRQTPSPSLASTRLSKRARPFPCLHSSPFLLLPFRGVAPSSLFNRRTDDGEQWTREVFFSFLSADRESCYASIQLNKSSNFVVSSLVVDRRSIFEKSSEDNRKIVEGSSNDRRSIVEGSSKDPRKIVEGSLKNHQRIVEGSSKNRGKIIVRSKDDVGRRRKKKKLSGYFLTLNVIYPPAIFQIAHLSLVSVNHSRGGRCSTLWLP